MRPVYPKCYAFAANGKETDAIERLTRYKATWQEIQGSYKGITERSFLVIETGADTEHLVRVLSQLYKQECYMILDAERDASLKYLNQLTPVHIGKLIPVSKDDALKQDAYSYSPTLDQYYVVEAK